MIKNNEQNGSVYTTLDSYIAGFLSLKGFIPDLIEQGNKVVFFFKASDTLYAHIAEYNAGAIVDASRFALEIKTLKSQIHSMRRNKGCPEKDEIRTTKQRRL